ncbi:MAG: AMP-binding protein, partial [Ectothiorhodospiraceae bacterium]
APNFGYELALRSLTPEGLEGLDLSSWRVAFNGAEPVSPDTMVRFIERLEPCGFRPEAMSPVYGLAEAAVGLCVPTPGRGVVLDCVDRESFANSGRAEPAGNGSDVLTFVNCGPPLPGYGIRVVDDAGRELPQRREGEIEFRGPSATAGYYSHSEATAELRHGDWLRTGDRGYLAGGDVHISGRQKDVIVRGGRNVYPYELEEAVGRIEGVRRGCVAVFGNPDPTSGAEALVVVAETRVEDDAARDRIEQAIREASLDIVDVPADDIRLVPPHSVLKTSSGKIRRAATRELYRAGRLGGPRSAVWQQVARMTLRSLFARLRLRVRRIGEWTYAAYAWTVFALAALPVWLLALVLPRRSWRWRVARLAARLAALVTGLRIERAGLENLPRNAQCILVANHASYLDALVLTAALPRGFCYLAKGELRERFFARKLLERMGAVFVDRFDPRQLGSDTRRVFAALDAGESLAFFPEGTFGSVPGLAAFHMGAFVAAARRRLPVVPVALAGTRSLMRGSEWFPRPGRARVAVGGALRATSDAWVEAVRLRDAARAFIAAECGEPDLTRE